jgi:hypothetical protein
MFTLLKYPKISFKNRKKQQQNNRYGCCLQKSSVENEGA